MTTLPTPPDFWPLDPEVVFLNHGSFGSCPRQILEFQQRMRRRLEQQPVDFFVRDLEPLLDQARAEVAAFVAAPPDDLVFIPNATAGVNTVLRSLTWQPGDELLVTNQAYRACRNALDFVAARHHATVTPVAVPFPLKSENQIVDAILDAVTPDTRLALLDHVTSPTALILPIARLVAELHTRGIDTLVDGAHAPGMVPLNLSELGATYYAANCHKWLCAPKGSGFLYVHPDKQEAIRPLVISHGASSSRTDRSRFQIEFAWTGTSDPTAYLAVPESIKLLQSVLPGGWNEIMSRNRRLTLVARDILCQSLQIDSPCPDQLLGSIASVPIPDGNGEPLLSPLYADPLQAELLNGYHIEVPILPWPASPKRLLRISAQLYNSKPQYQLLADALKELL